MLTGTTPVSSVRDDFSLRSQLLSFNDDWINFESKVLACCDTVLRPYAASSSAISARLLTTREFYIFFVYIFFTHTHKQKRRKRCYPKSLEHGHPESSGFALHKKDYRQQ